MKPTTSAEFDHAYRAPFTFWGDVRIPDELKALVRQAAPRRSLELGCGVGRLSRYLAQQGVQATAVDFSPVAIAKARASVVGAPLAPEYLVGDVTRLDGLTGPFDISFDVGCFHCLDDDGQRRYVAEVHRLLAPGGTHLLWALDESPIGMTLSPERVRETFSPAFTLQDARPSRRRLIRSHWYWLTRARNA